MSNVLENFKKAVREKAVDPEEEGFDGKWAGVLGVSEIDVRMAVLEALSPNGTNGTDPGPQPDVPFEEPSQPSYHLTDIGNAERLARAHGCNLRYCHPWKRWLVWDGLRWNEDKTGEVCKLAKETAKSIYAEAVAGPTDEDRKGIAKWAVRSESREKVSAMVELAQTEKGIPILPEQLDGNKWLFNCSNGTLNLKDGSFQHHDRELLLTKLAPVRYDPAATCPTWEAFLRLIFKENDNLIRFVQKAAGYSLTGDTSEQCFFILHGSGANGKSTLLSALREMMGDYAQKTPAETILLKRSGGIPNDVAALRGSRFVTASESEDGRKLAESLIKDMTGGEVLTARFLHAEFFSFYPLFKIWLSTNHKPVIRGTDYAIWRRIRLIPFDVTIPEEERDPRFPDKLNRELSGILNWAVEGCRLWQEEGLEPPPEVKAATEGYREEQDLLGAFLAEYCEFGEEKRVRAGDLYDLFTDQHGTRELSKTAFGKAMAERGFDSYPDNEKDDVTGKWKKVRFYIGLSLK